MNAKVIIASIVTVGVCIGFGMILLQQTKQQPVVFERGALTIRGSVFTVEIADTQKKRQRGLQHRTQLDPISGMVFVFDQADVYSFWMKNTVVPLDIVWVRQGRVVQITENVPPQAGVPDSQLRQYTPNTAVDSVIEFSAGIVKSAGILVGDEVVLQTP